MNDAQHDWLCDVYRKFCTDHNLPHLSADEQELETMTEYQQNFINTFISIWEDLGHY